MEAIIFSTWLLVMTPWGKDKIPVVYLQDIATQQECERIRTTLIPQVERDGFSCVELKKAK